jgi:predicted nucleotidyltransferase
MNLAFTNKVEYPNSMISRKSIRQLAIEIAREFSPEKIVLFGSYAGGRPDKDSDVDLLVIMNHRRRKGGL